MTQGNPIPDPDALRTLRRLETELHRTVRELGGRLRGPDLFDRLAGAGATPAEFASRAIRLMVLRSTPVKRSILRWLAAPEQRVDADA